MRGGRRSDLVLSEDAGAEAGAMSVRSDGFIDFSSRTEKLNLSWGVAVSSAILSRIRYRVSSLLPTVLRIFEKREAVMR